MSYFILFQSGQKSINIIDTNLKDFSNFEPDPPSKYYFKFNQPKVTFVTHESSRESPKKHKNHKNC